jgi:hypothetical protein
MRSEKRILRSFARPHNGLGAQSAPKDSGDQPKGEGYKGLGAPWLVSTLVFAGIFTLLIVMNRRAAAEEQSDRS